MAGGKRLGAGRPKGAPTRVLSVRVPELDYERLRLAVLALVGRMLRAKVTPRTARGHSASSSG